MTCKKFTATSLALMLLLAGAGGAPAAEGPATIWRFLGIPQGYNKLRDASVNRNGNRPGLERKPPMKQIADPENLESKNPAIKKAAEIKQEEDLAPQKIKALKYLAKVGCGCYPGVKEALMAALDDCTERVRYEAAKQIGEAAVNKCAVCSNNCCCDEELSKKLAEIAYEKDDKCCWLEPSERVREAAKEAMQACCRMAKDRGGVSVEAQKTEIKEDRPSDSPYEEDRPSDDAPTPPEDGVTQHSAGSSGKLASLESKSETDDAVTIVRIVPAQSGKAVSRTSKPAHKSAQKQSTPASTSATTGRSRDGVGTNVKVAQEARPAKASTVSLHGAEQGDQHTANSHVGRPIEGLVSAVDQKTGTVQVEFIGDRRPPVGSRLKVNKEYALEMACVGELQIVFLAKNGRVIGQPVGKLNLDKLSKGDQVLYYQPAKKAAPKSPAPKPVEKVAQKATIRTKAKSESTPTAARRFSHEPKHSEVHILGETGESESADSVVWIDDEGTTTR